MLFSEVLGGMLVLESFTKHPPSTCAEHIMLISVAPAVTCVTASTNLAPPAAAPCCTRWIAKKPPVMAKIWEARGLRLEKRRFEAFRFGRAGSLARHFFGFGPGLDAGRGRLRAWGRFGAQWL